MRDRSSAHRFLSDDAIVELYWQRNEKAVSETDIKYGRFLFRIAYNILHDRADSEECQNDTYLGIWNAIPPARPKVFPAFITQIMRRVAINRYKKNASQKRVPSELTVSLEDYENQLISNDSVDQALSVETIGRSINDFVRKLPDRQRYIFIARYYYAESVEKIASDLETALATVYRDLHAIKQGLLIELGENEVKL